MSRSAPSRRSTPPRADARGLRHGDLHVVDVSRFQIGSKMRCRSAAPGCSAPSPCRGNDRCGTPSSGKTFVTLRLSSGGASGRGRTALDDHPAPLVPSWAGEIRPAELLEHHGEGLRGGWTGRTPVAPVPWSGRGRRPHLEVRRTRRVVEAALGEAEPLREAVPHRPGRTGCGREARTAS